MAYGEEDTAVAPDPTTEPTSGGAEKVISRERPEPTQQRTALVKNWLKKVENGKKKWEKLAFNRMREDMDFAEGYQWESENGFQNASESNKYVANLTLRHVNERVASLYAKNPRAVAKRSDRMESALWDGSSEPVMQAQQSLDMGMQSGMPPDQNALALLMEVAQVLERRKMIDGVGKTLVSLFHYFMREGSPPFKVQAKQLVRRVETCGVGYIKLGFQRLTGSNPEIVQRLQDVKQRLDHIEALAADMADEQIEESEAEAEELRLSIQTLQAEAEIILREGLVFDFPEATALIPDPKTKHIRGFIGARWLAESYEYTADDILEKFQVDIGSNFTSFTNKDAEDGDSAQSLAHVYQIHDMQNGMELWVCEGYPDFLKEPGPMAVFIEQGHPYFALTFNNLESRKCPFPPSDVRLLMPMQMEHNRSREGLRVHRIGNRPAYVAATGMMDEKDLQKFGDHADNEIIEVKMPAAPGMDIGKLIGAKPTVPIDPNLYETSHLFEDMQRTTGSATPQFGGTSGDTATEASIAESSRLDSVGSNIDDMDDFLSMVARGAGQVMLAEMSEETVKKYIGQGAVWPELSRKEISEEVYLEIQAGSSGRPNKAAELANVERIAPLLLQIPGLPPKKLAETLLTRMDESIDIDEWFVEGLPSIIAINAAAKGQMPGMGAGPPGGQPGGPPEGNMPQDQGAQGANNQEQPPGFAGGAQPAYPTPGEQPGPLPMMGTPPLQ